MENLDKKEINKTIGKVTKALNDEKQSILIMTEETTLAKGNLVEILSDIGLFLKKVRSESLIGKLAVDGMINAMEELKKQDKKLEDMTEEELFDELKETLGELKRVLK